MGTHFPRRPSIQHTGGRRSHVQMHAPPVVAAGPHTHVNGVSKFSAIKTPLFGYLELGSLGG